MNVTLAVIFLGIKESYTRYFLYLKSCNEVLPFTFLWLSLRIDLMILIVIEGVLFVLIKERKFETRS